MRDVGPNIMWPLQQTGSDELGLFLPRAEGVIRKAIFVLYVPETYPWLEIKTIPENAGKELDDSEYLRLRLYPPNGFRPIGWMFENVKADGIFGVTYHDSSKETACETGSDN